MGMPEKKLSKYLFYNPHEAIFFYTNTTMELMYLSGNNEEVVLREERREVHQGRKAHIAYDLTVVLFVRASCNPFY